MENATFQNETDGQCEPLTEPLIATARRYLVPILVITGIIGNTLILVVLNNGRSMRTKTNLLLSFMAWSDLVHAVGTFIYQLPLYQAYFDLRDIYPGMQIPLLTVIRFSGMSSNWFGVAVTVERLMAIRSPLTTVTRNRSIFKLAVLIFVISLIICAQPIVCWSGGSEETCHGQVIYFYEQPSHVLWHFYCLIWEQVSAYCYIVIPVVLMFACNAALIYYMQRHSTALLRFSSRRVDIRKHLDVPDPKRGYGSLSDNNSTSDTDRAKVNRWNGRRAATKPKKEMQAAVVVLALSLTSACMSLPSAVGATYYFVAWMSDNLPEDEARSWYATYGEISNLLFLAEKNIAVFIYCVTSARFRRRLLAVLKCKKEKVPSKPIFVPFSTTILVAQSQRNDDDQ